MLTYNEVIELRERLFNKAISAEDAKAMYWKDFKEGKRAWHSKDWKKRRVHFIKNECEICGSRETLTLQHRSHPKNYGDYEREVTKMQTQSFRESNNALEKDELYEYILKNYDYAPVPICPNCKTKSLRKRVRKLPQYACIDCKAEFDGPTYRSIEELISIFVENEESYEVRDKCFISKNKWKNEHRLAEIKYWLQREGVKTKERDEISRTAFLLFLDDIIKYLSFEDTITACKKCASYYDLYRMEICPICKKKYKSILYESCIDCLPEEKRESVLKSIEFGKEWNAMHKSLEID